MRTWELASTRMLTVFSPSDIERITGIAPQTLRDWRRRGFLDSVGVSDGGRWRYLRDHVIALAVADLLIEGGLVVTRALQIGSFATPHLFAWLDPTPTAVAGREPRFIAVWPGPQGSLPGTLHVERLHSLASLAQLGAPYAVTLDCLKMAEMLRADLAPVLRASS